MLKHLFDALNSGSAYPKDATFCEEFFLIFLLFSVPLTNNVLIVACLYQVKILTDNKWSKLAHSWFDYDGSLIIEHSIYSAYDLQMVAASWTSAGLTATAVNIKEKLTSSGSVRTATILPP